MAATDGEGSGPPLLTEPVIGYRQWRVVGDELHPLGLRHLVTPWRGAEEVQARCEVARLVADFGAAFGAAARLERSRHDAPAPSCHCGFNAYHEPTTNLGSERVYLVGGAIIARGVIEVHHRGFRSEFARPIALVDPTAGVRIAAALTRESRRVRRVARANRIPVVAADELVAFALERGAPVPEALRPEPAPGTFHVHLSGFAPAAPPLANTSFGNTYITGTTHITGVYQRPPRRPNAAELRAAKRFLKRQRRELGR